MDFDIKRVRTLWIFMRTIEIFILSLLALYVVFLAYFILFDFSGLSFQFLIYLYLIVVIEIIWTNKDMFFTPSLSPFSFENETHMRHPNETEKNIVKSFFEIHKLETSTFFVQANPDCYNAFVGYSRSRGTVIYVINERLFRSCSVREIWAILAHERGHVKNGDVAGFGMTTTDIKDWLFYLSFWFSLLVLLKIFLYSWYFPEELLFSFGSCLIISCYVVLFLVGLRNSCDKWISNAMQVLADNTGVQILGSAMWMLECLQMLDNRIYFPDYSLRKKALLWILSDKTLKF